MDGHGPGGGRIVARLLYIRTVLAGSSESLGIDLGDALGVACGLAWAAPLLNR
jgi:hypothetical protein